MVHGFSLAQALHISRSEVQKWIDRGWLQCSTVQGQGVTRKIIDASCCLFVKNRDRTMVGNRLSYEGLAFVRDHVFPRPHADLLSVRGPFESQWVGADLQTVAKRVGWFKEPEDAKDVKLFFAHVMTYGTLNDRYYLALFLGGGFKSVLMDPPPGMLDRRSWTYWNVRFHREPVPDLPKRKLS